MMKANPAQALYVLIAVVIMYLIYRRTHMDLENYVKRPASIDDVLKMSENGLVKVYPYDLKYPRKYILEKDGEYFRIKGEFPGTKKKYYFSVKDVIPSLWGHMAGAGFSEVDANFINERVAVFLNSDN